mgnify:CR=1 FL=1
MQKNEPNSAEWHIDPKTGELIDPDEAPELDEQWFAEADLYDGDKLVLSGFAPSEAAHAALLRAAAERLGEGSGGGRSSRPERRQEPRAERMRQHANRPGVEVDGREGGVHFDRNVACTRVMHMYCATLGQLDGRRE